MSESIIKNKQSRRIYAALLAGMLGLAGCVNTTQVGVTGVDRRQLMLVSSDEVNNMAAKQYTSTVGQARTSGKLDDNPALVARLRVITNRLIAQTPRFRPDAATWKWEVHLVNNPELNANCMPGGKIMVYSGIITKLGLTDDEIAAILGHEISHALREHGREQVSRQMAQQVGLGILASAAGLSDGATQAVGMAAQLGFDLPHSREQETEADTLGLELMARAGYNPQAALSLWQKMANASTGEPPKFLSTHPSNADRYARIQALLPQVTPLYLAARGRG